MKNKIILFTFLGFIVIFVGLTAFYFFKERDRKSVGVVLIPNEEVYVPIDYFPYYISDSFPNAKKFEDNSRSLSTALYALTNCINQYGNHYSFEFVDSLWKVKEGFRNEHSLNWKKIEQIFEGYSYYQSRNLKATDIIKALELGRTPIVLLKDLNGRDHFGLIIGAKKNQFLIYKDGTELAMSAKTLPLQRPISTYGDGKIYGIWVVFPTSFRTLDRTKR